MERLGAENAQCQAAEAAGQPVTKISRRESAPAELAKSMAADAVQQPNPFASVLGTDVSSLRAANSVRGKWHRQLIEKAPLAVGTIVWALPLWATFSEAPRQGIIRQRPIIGGSSTYALFRSCLGQE